jgi:hypothetical protein
MKLLLDLLQGAGLAAAAGLRPFLPALLAGGLASATWAWTSTTRRSPSSSPPGGSWR